ncbi:MAG: MarR family transcriptional regulator [Gammaproteobacteria bacterium]|jgi:predicted transcriptional regulator|nr:MarR family transcriptional regulator [Gammaproteobacteria bacterium]MBT3488997.1 MarR family transcriptional regulator [Gammaproteobacteria bacterium]MBT3718824.1 MarR family transcriptional regulator [Gammaproteobacteria bacterium]MBT3844320.1 MarR family transcriptional regulator [Gammaproteobacteria bacterium]MBT3892154.1 MarR family transcriptional regulator [Gammaproteobacteria bacterium]
MSKVTVRADDLEGFFSRARDAAQRADQGGVFEEKVTISFEDPQQMFSVLSEARRRLMSEVMHQPGTISELSNRLHRDRSSISKDIGMLEEVGLIVSKKEPNPGHGTQKWVRAVAPEVEVVATLH